MKRGLTGRYENSHVGEETVKAFVPNPLPPMPLIELTGARQLLLDQALLGLGRLDSIATLLPDPHLFLYAYVRKEAVLSSQIEGTQSSLSDLLLFELEEAPGAPLDDVVDVSNYVAALEYGLERLRGGFPLSNRLIREVHAKLLSRGRGSDKLPGEFRQSQNWIGGARPGNAHFVPPPPQVVEDCMGHLEQFLHDEKSPLPVLVKAALAHVQFETVHPFLDGNGRVGRLLITLLLCQAGVLTEPLLYLSLYFKQNRATYYSLLDEVRRDGDWEAWIDFFLEGVRTTARGAVTTAQRLVELFNAQEGSIQKSGRAAGSALRVHTALRERPILSLPDICRRTGLSFPAATNGMTLLEKLGTVRELTGRQRNRLFAYDRYLQILSEGTEPL
jgi:Fic family protein